jgi:hypothetical protein
MRALSRPVSVHDGVRQGDRLIRHGKLVYRQNRITRATHWINLLALVILVMSGFQIFNAHPHLYWGHSSEPDDREKIFKSPGGSSCPLSMLTPT